jgi:hypothetical protein
MNESLVTYFSKYVFDSISNEVIMKCFWNMKLAMSNCKNLSILENRCRQPCKKVCRDKEKSFISVSLFACEVIDSIGHNNC